MSWKAAGYRINYKRTLPSICYYLYPPQLMEENKGKKWLQYRREVATTLMQAARAAYLLQTGLEHEAGFTQAMHSYHTKPFPSQPWRSTAWWTRDFAWLIRMRLNCFRREQSSHQACQVINSMLFHCYILKMDSELVDLQEQFLSV